MLIRVIFNGKSLTENEKKLLVTSEFRPINLSETETDLICLDLCQRVAESHDGKITFEN